MDALGQDTDCSTDGAHLVEASAIHAFAVLDDLLAHQLLGQCLEAVAKGLAIGADGDTDRVVVLQALDRFEEMKTVVLGISPDSEASHANFCSKFQLGFDLLADPEKKACQAYGVWQSKVMYGRKSMGVVRTTYLIDPDGVVAHRWDKVSVADHANEVLKVLAEQTDR